jgi:hypothetical protein
VLARGEAVAPYIGRSLARDDRMTAKMPPWYGGVSAARGTTDGPAVRSARAYGAGGGRCVARGENEVPRGAGVWVRHGVGVDAEAASAWCGAWARRGAARATSRRDGALAETISD